MGMMFQSLGRPNDTVVYKKLNIVINTRVGDLHIAILNSRNAGEATVVVFPPRLSSRVNA